MKKLFKILAVLAILIVGGIGFIFYLTSGLTEVGQNFFVAAGAGDVKKAYSYLSESFQKTTTPEQLEAYLKSSGTKDATSTSWNSRKIENGSGRIRGIVTTRSGGSIPVDVGLVKEHDAWKIFSLHASPAGLSGGGDTTAAPSEDESVLLVKESMHEFALAINTKSFENFHKYAAEVWRREISAEKLKDVFKGFIDQEVNLLVLDNLAPKFDAPPVISDNGVLTVKGYFPTTPSRTFFDLGYMFEGLGWKLVSIGVNLRPAE